MENRYTSFENLPLFLSVTELGRLLGISRANAYELVHVINGIKSLRIGKRIIVPSHEVIDWIEKQVKSSDQ